MPRNISVKFSLLTIAGKVSGAIDKPVAMKNLCVGQPGSSTLTHEPTPLIQPKQCPTCGPIVDDGMLKKGIKQGSGYAVVDQIQVAQARESFGTDYKKVITLVPHPAQDFLANTAPGDSVDYIEPADVAAQDHYQLLVKLIESHPELAFVGLHTPLSATSLYQVTVRDGVLVLNKRTREQSFLPAPSVGGTVNDALYTMLDTQVLPISVTPYKGDAYEDKYLEAVQALADNASETIGNVAKQPGAAEAIISSDDDLMAKLAELAKGA